MTRAEIARVMTARGYRYVKTCAGRIPIAEWANLAPSEVAHLDDACDAHALTDGQVSIGGDTKIVHILRGLWVFTVDSLHVPLPSYDREIVSSSTLDEARERGTFFRLSVRGREIGSTLHAFTPADAVRCLLYYQALREADPLLKNDDAILVEKEIARCVWQEAGYFDREGRDLGEAGEATYRAAVEEERRKAEEKRRQEAQIAWEENHAVCAGCDEGLFRSQLVALSDREGLYCYPCRRRLDPPKPSEVEVQVPDTAPGNYYVSALYYGKHVLLLGPFLNNHGQALALVDRARELAHELDPRAPWYAYGTCRVDLSEEARPGILNDRVPEAFAPTGLDQ